MMSLLLFVFTGLGFFVAFLAIGLSGHTENAPDTSAVSAVGHMIQLRGYSFANSRRLLDDSEYRILVANPALQTVAKRLLAERKELILEWIGVLMADMNSLWRFRRFLVRHGVETGIGEELRILGMFTTSVGLLIILKTSVRVAGPFALIQPSRRADAVVEKMSDAAASLLERVPSAAWSDIERSWAGSAA
jgi:hypothetical protein